MMLKGKAELVQRAFGSVLYMDASVQVAVCYSDGWGMKRGFVFGGFHFSVDYMSVSRLRAESTILHNSLVVFTRRSGRRRNDLV